MSTTDDHTATVDAAGGRRRRGAARARVADADLLVTEIKADIEQERKEQERRRRWGR